MSNKVELDQLKKEIEHAERSLRRASDILRNLSKDKSYEDIPGILGTFDGFNMVAQDGALYEVPANYAAKSLLVFGDGLKMVDEDGKKLFKQVSKVARKVVEGVLNKKEGKWHVLTDFGSFRISDRAAEFNKALINDKVAVVIPENHVGATFAALERIIKDKQTEPVTQPVKPFEQPVAKVSAESVERLAEPVVEKAPKKGSEPAKDVTDRGLTPKVKPSVKPKAAKPKPPAEPNKGEKVNTISVDDQKKESAQTLEDDDLR